MKTNSSSSTNLINYKNAPLIVQARRMLRFSMSTGNCDVFSLTPLETGLSYIHLPVTKCNSLKIEQVQN